MSSLTYSIRDYSDEYGQVRLQITDVTAVNFDAEFGTAEAALRAAIDDLVIGTVAYVNKNVGRELIDDTRPADAAAQREQGLRVFGRDTNGKLHSFTLPCPDLALVAQAGTDLVDLTVTEVAALVTALEAHWEPQGQTGIIIEKMVIVGRNN